MSSHVKNPIYRGATPHSKLYQGYFGRLFRNLPPFKPSASDVEAAIRAIADQMIEPLETDETVEYTVVEGDTIGHIALRFGLGLRQGIADIKRLNNIADGRTLQVGTVLRIPSASGLDNPEIPAGYTYFGQFIDHDITFDPTSSLQRQNDPNLLQNFRTPCFDLDNLYGRGPHDNPFLYDKDKPGKFLIGTAIGDREEDLPRNHQNRALIGDPRNDENIFVSQLQLGFLKFHNAMIDFLSANRGLSGDELFKEAQRQVRWHYQYVVIHDFLKRIIGEARLNSLLPDASKHPSKPQLKFYEYKHKPFMPVEFSVAAYRFGHSMVRPAYTLNHIVGGSFPLPIFDHQQFEESLGHFGGFRRLPRFWTIQWDQFLQAQGSPAPQPSRRIDRFLADPLIDLPANVNPDNLSLAFLNLQRGHSMGLPSGQDVARAMGIASGEILHPDEHNPLWQYILDEAGKQEKGERLGVVGGTIVGEVFLGLLAGDALSYLNIDPLWTPEREGIVAAMGAKFELIDILKFAGAAITQADFDAATQ